MFDTNTLKYIRNAALALPLAALPVKAEASEFTAGVVVTKMAEADRYPFLSGIIEGMAYARYKKGRRQD